jgi:GNAT superfamily N-acetyltransferase
VEGIPIRNARRGDVPSLLMLWTAMMAENARADPRVALHPHAKEHMASRFGEWVHDPERVVVVAEEHHRLVVGYAAGRVAPGTGWHTPLRVGEISDCFVVPPRRRQGIARRMVGRLCDMLYELNVDTVRLQVVAANPSSLGFWQATGWDLLEEILEYHEGE